LPYLFRKPLWFFRLVRFTGISIFHLCSLFTEVWSVTTGFQRFYFLLSHPSS
jgi:hypothetical protein